MTVVSSALEAVLGHNLTSGATITSGDTFFISNAAYDDETR